MTALACPQPWTLRLQIDPLQRVGSVARYHAPGQVYACPHHMFPWYAIMCLDTPWSGRTGSKMDDSQSDPSRNVPTHGSSVDAGPRQPAPTVHLAARAHVE